nr:hypothetical protein CE91St29_06190 [Corynebacterium striatum]
MLWLSMRTTAWLLWHSGRMADIQLAALIGEPEAWERFDIALPDSMGYGQIPEEARATIAPRFPTPPSTTSSTPTGLRT